MAQHPPQPQPPSLPTPLPNLPPALPDRRAADPQILVLQEKVDGLEGELQTIQKDLQDLTAALNRQRGAFFLGNILVGTCTAIMLATGSWAFGTINRTQLDLKEQGQKLIEGSNLLQAHGLLEFHSGAQPMMRRIEGELAVLRVTLQRMDEEQKRQGAGQGRR